MQPYLKYLDRVLNESVKTNSILKQPEEYKASGDPVGLRWLRNEVRPTGLGLKMKKTFLVLLLVCCMYSLVNSAGQGHTKTWVSSGSTNANLAANYDLFIAPVAGDTIILDAHSTVQWIPTASISGDHITIKSSYGTTINLGGFTVPKIVNYKPGLTILNNGTVGALVFGTVGSKIVFQAGKTITVSSLSAANWNGSAGHLDSLVSNTVGTQATIHIPGHVTLNYLYFRDIHISGDTVTCPWSQGCRSGGGNQ